MSEPNEEELTPEQEALAQQFAAELEGVTGGQIAEDENGAWWLTFGDFSVPMTTQQREEFAEWVYASAVAKVRSLAPQPKKTSLDVRVAGWFIVLGFGGTVVWGLAKLFGIL